MGWDWREPKNTLQFLHIQRSSNTCNRHLYFMDATPSHYYHDRHSWSHTPTTWPLPFSVNIWISCFSSKYDTFYGNHCIRSCSDVSLHVCGVRIRNLLCRVKVRLRRHKTENVFLKLVIWINLIGILWAPICQISLCQSSQFQVRNRILHWAHLMVFIIVQVHKVSESRLWSGWNRKMKKMAFSSLEGTMIKMK